LSSTGEVGKFHAHKPWEEFRNLAPCYTFTSEKKCEHKKI